MRSAAGPETTSSARRSSGSCSLACPLGCWKCGSARLPPGSPKERRSKVKGLGNVVVLDQPYALCVSAAPQTLVVGAAESHADVAQTSFQVLERHGRLTLAGSRGKKHLFDRLHFLPHQLAAMLLCFSPPLW